MKEKENNITKYQGLSFAVPFIQEIKKHISNDPRYGNVVDFVKEAAREKMYGDMLVKLSEEIKELKKENNGLKRAWTHHNKTICRLEREIVQTRIDLTERYYLNKTKKSG